MSYAGFYVRAPELQQAKRLTLWNSLRATRFAFWYEDGHNLVSFREAFVA